MVDEYDFDWDGDTLEVGDEEAQTFVVPQEPTGNQQGVDAPGPLSAHADLYNFGVLNGNFRQGPPDPSQNLDVASSTTGSNFMPGWRFVQSSNANITAKQVRDTSSPSGSNLRFTIASGASGDEAYVEQVVDIGGSRARWAGDSVRSYWFGGAGNTGTFLVEQRLQYLTADGTIVGMPAEQSNFGTVAAGGVRLLQDVAEGDTASIPATARYLRVREIVRRDAAATSATGTLDLTDVRRARALPEARLSDISDPTTYKPGKVSQTAGILTAQPGSTDTTYLRLTSATAVLAASTLITLDAPYIEVNDDEATPTGSAGAVKVYGQGGHLFAMDEASTARLLTGQLVAIPFALLNIPAGATTPLQIADNALGIASPYIRAPWGGSIVGLSYRLSAAVGAGTLRLDATRSGSNVWTAFSAAALGASDHATQAPGTDTFGPTQPLGIDAVANGSLTAGLDIAALLWVLIDYDGT